MEKFINPFSDYGLKRIFGQEINKDYNNTMEYAKQKAAKEGMEKGLEKGLREGENSERSGNSS